MCGIVGYVGQRPARDIVVDALRRMEYRGYDSAGSRAARRRRRSDGAPPRRPAGQPGGGAGRDRRRPVSPAAPGSATPAGPPTAGPPTATRTRTATPRARSPSSTTASSRTSRRCARSWRPPVWSSPATPTPRSPCTWSRRPTHHGDTAGDFAASVLAVLRRLEGHFTLVFANADEPGTIVAARRSTPLVLGVGDGEMFVGSDVAAFIEHTRDAVELGQDQAVVITADGYRITDFHGDRMTSTDYREFHIDWDLSAAEKGGYEYFMLKEIAEQPAAVADTLLGPLRRRPHRARRAAAVRSGAARDRQGVRGRLRHRVSLRAAGQVRDRALDPAARRGRAGQRIPLPRPGSGPQHAGGRDLAVRRDRRHAGGGAARQGAEGQGAGDLQHQRQPDPARVRRGALHPRRPGDRGRVDQDVPGPDRRQLPGRAGAGAGPRHQIPRRGGARVPRAGVHARAGRAGAGDRRTGRRAGAPVRRSRRPCCSSAATSATRSRSRVR